MLGYTSCVADPDLQIIFRGETSESDGFKYYAFLVFYVDDDAFNVLIVHHY